VIVYVTIGMYAITRSAAIELILTITHSSNLVQCVRASLCIVLAVQLVRSIINPSSNMLLSLHS
jgi:hypothetical protein